jgi:predicted nuclease of predicted toxin-antitoxin system
MRFLLDNNLSPKLVDLLASAGHDVIHVRDHGLERADDASIMALAVETDRVVVSADTDFGTLLAATRATRPSFVLVRRIAGRRAAELAALIATNIPAVVDDLTEGAVVVIGESSLRIRRLPIG